MDDRLTIQPWIKPVSGYLKLPGSKSITARALILSALSDGYTHLRGFSASDDTLALLGGLQALGFHVVNSPTSLFIKGEQGKIPLSQATIDIQQSGTAGRFLPALAALHPAGIYHFRSYPSFEKRPMEGLLNTLEQQGASIIYHGRKGHYPFTLYSRGLTGGIVNLPARETTQYLSAFMMVQPYAKSPLHIQSGEMLISAPFIKMTQQMIDTFKSHSHLQADRFYDIEPDITAASYAMAAVCLHGGRICLHQAGKVHLQGDRRFADMLRPYGLSTEIQQDDLILTADGLEPQCHPQNLDFRDISDTFITFAALAPLLGGPITIKGIGHTAQQESDRPMMVAENLQRLGQKIILSEDKNTLTIYPQPLQPACIETAQDHRIAMSFGILGTYALKGKQPWLSIRNPSVCRKTWPRYFDEFCLAGPDFLPHNSGA